MIECSTDGVLRCGLTDVVSSFFIISSQLEIVICQMIFLSTKLTHQIWSFNFLSTFISLFSNRCFNILTSV
ncbi:hypothetical protein HanRHA438_Chr10g0459721 [Helianthus annuus]|nr:hypothetical protein HanRHA438_Chr10g0459721 [Helianthus annuus]